MSDTEPDHPPYRFLPSGVVEVTIGDHMVRLRRPLFGEYRKFRESYSELRAHVAELIEPLREEAVKVDEAAAAFRARSMNQTAREQRIYELGKLDPISPRSQAELDRLKKADGQKALTAADRKKGTEAVLRQQSITDDIDDATATGWGEWSRTAFAAMSDAECPPVDQMDPTFSTQSFVVELLAHWRTVPLAPGR